MPLPARLRIDGRRTRRVTAALADMAGWPVVVRTRDGVVHAGAMTCTDDTLHLRPLPGGPDQPPTGVTEPIAVRLDEVVAIEVLRAG